MSHQSCITLCLLGVGLLSVHPAAASYDVRYQYQLFPQNNGDPSHVYVTVYEPDGLTSLAVDTGMRLSGLDPAAIDCDGAPAAQGFARSTAAVDLARGRVAASGSAGGYVGLAHGGASFNDEVTFQLPAGMTDATVGFSLVIPGTFTTLQQPGYDVSGYAQVSLGSVTIDNGGDQPAATFIGQTLSGSATVTNGATVGVGVFVIASTQLANVCLPQALEFDFAAYLVLDVPAGVTYTSSSGVLLTADDSDADGIPDSDDNCTLHTNPSQLDTNGDGFGNRCDADLNDDGIVNTLDLGIFRQRFFTVGANDADFNGDGVVNPLDLGILRALFFKPPGPAGAL